MKNDCIQYAWRGLLGICLLSIAHDTTLAQSDANAQSENPNQIEKQISRTESQVETLIRASQPKVVKIFGASAGRVQGYATGIVVSSDGSILTISGVLLDGQQIRVIMSDGTEHFARVIRRDREKQLALLKITAENLPHFDLDKDSQGEKGDWVLAICNAFKVADKAEPLSATLGVVSLRTTMEAWLNKRDVAYRGELVLVDCITSNPGAGGGAVIDTDGNLVGMIGKIISSSETNTRINYAVPNQVLKEFVEKKGSFVEVTQPKSTGADLGLRLFTQGGRNAPAYIDRVKRRSPAYRAKLKSDDLIISLAGEKIGTIEQYEEVLDRLPVGEEIIVIVKRGAELIRIPITPVKKK